MDDICEKIAKENHDKAKEKLIRNIKSYFDKEFGNKDILPEVVLDGLAERLLSDWFWIKEYLDKQCCARDIKEILNGTEETLSEGQIKYAIDLYVENGYIDGAEGLREAIYTTKRRWGIHV